MDSQTDERCELNGRLLKGLTSPDHWLVLHGRRRRLVSSAVMNALFPNRVEAEVRSDLDQVPVGADLVEGSCLIKADDGLSVFLFTGSDDWGLRRHFIPTYEDLVGFGFDMTKIRSLPGLVVAALPAGPDICVHR